MIDKINQALWLVATVLLIGGGIYFTFRLSFVQLRFKTMFRSFKTKEKEEISEKCGDTIEKKMIL